MLALNTISDFFKPLWISSFMEQENKSLSLLGLYSESHFYRNSVQSYPVLSVMYWKLKTWLMWLWLMEMSPQKLLLLKLALRKAYEIAHWHLSDSLTTLFLGLGRGLDCFVIAFLLLAVSKLIKNELQWKWEPNEFKKQLFCLILPCNLIILWSCVHLRWITLMALLCMVVRLSVWSFTPPPAWSKRMSLYKLYLSYFIILNSESFFVDPISKSSSDFCRVV